MIQLGRKFVQFFPQAMKNDKVYLEKKRKEKTSKKLVSGGHYF